MSPRPHRIAGEAAATQTRRRGLQGLLGLCVLGLAGQALAGPLADPTRPPASLATPQRDRGLADIPGGPGSPAQAPGKAAPPPAPTPLPLVLQSLHSPSQGAASALINGQLVKAGDHVAGRQVVSIERQGVLLRGSAGEERLWLLGSANKQAAGSIQAATGTRYKPAPDEPSGSAPTDPPTRAERNTPGDTLTGNAATALSVAGRTKP